MEINTGREYIDGKEVAIEDFARDCGLEILWSDKGCKIPLSTVSVNRPGLVLSGFNDYFAAKRIQVMGNAEMYFLYKMGTEECDKALHALFGHKIPCLIISRRLHPTDHMLDIAKQYACPILSSDKITSNVVNDLVNYLNDQLAPETTVHGELLDVDGIGVLITGNSGIGKSEVALELVHRGHMLVADDNVVVKRVKDKVLGRPSEAIRDFLEVRGVGIINVKNMYGVAGVLPESKIDVCIHLDKWDETKSYDRFGDEQLTTSLLGVDVPKTVIPVMPGRNIAIVVEVVAKNLRLKHMGYDALEEIKNRNNIG